MLRSAVSPAVAARARGAVRIPRASPALRAPAAAPTRGMAGRRKAKARDGVVAATSDSGERTAALEAALRHIESSHGKGAVMRLGERSEPLPHRRTPFPAPRAAPTAPPP